MHSCGRSVSRDGSGMNDYQCDKCGKVFELGEDSFYGQLDGDEECSPFVKLTALCPACLAKGGAHEQDNKKGTYSNE